MIKIDQALLDSVSARAKQSPRQRRNYNFHLELSDPLQRMLNVMEPFSYIRPHKHENPDKVETFVILTGRMLVVEFNTDGTIADHLLLDTSLGVFGAEIPPKTFHTIIPLESCTAVYEVKNGPYHPINDKDFASWAPREGETGCIDYLNGIIKRLGIL